MRSAVFVDTSILLLAAGTSADQPACAAALRGWREASTEVHIAAEIVQEFAFHRRRVGDVARAIRETRALLAASVVHPLDEKVLERGLDLMGAGLRGRDAMIAATALLAGFTELVSADSDFDGVPGLQRVDPRHSNP